MKPIEIVDTDLEFAILDIFTELNVPQGGRLAMETIEKTWSQTGLRESDLMRGLDCLNRKGYLQPTENDETLFFQLTAEGKKHSGLEYNLTSVKQRFHANKMLRRSRSRRFDESAHPHEAANVERRRNVRLPGFDEAETIDLSEMGITDFLDDDDSIKNR